MKLAKMSMVAALLLGANAFAIENVKVSGDAKLYYSTDDSTNAGNNGGLFERTSSAAQAALGLDLTADLLENVSAGVSFTALSTLGLENNLVANGWEAQTAAWASDYWFNEAWIATTMGKTTAKLGRQTLDTPLAFTETWSIAENTFEAAVLINQDIADTTLVGAYIGSHNSAGGVLGTGNSGAFAAVVGAPVVANGDSRFTQTAGFGNGAYTIGAVNNSFKPVTAQLWYYDIVSTGTAVWAQADLDMDGILGGIQYTTLDVNGLANTGDATALMVGYAMKDVATFKVAYSMTDDNVGAGQNVAGQQSKLYTELWWNYGLVDNANTDTILVSAEATVSDIDLYAGYGMVDTGAANADLNELTITASKSYGALDTSVAFINTDADAGAVGVAGNNVENMLQVYLTLNF